MKHMLIALLTSSSLLSGCTVLDLRTGEEALFSSSYIDGDYEIRTYEPIIIAQTTVTGAYSTATRTGYTQLTNYVSGNNLAKQTVSVNAPVTVADGAKAPKVELTLPYYEEYIDNTWVVSVAMPEAYTLATLPKPIAGDNITFKILPRLKVAVIDFSGFKSESLISNKTALLNDWVSKNSLTPLSAPRSVIYNSPWAVPALRRHEIHISIK